MKRLSVTCFMLATAIPGHSLTDRRPPAAEPYNVELSLTPDAAAADHYWCHVILRHRGTRQVVASPKLHLKRGVSGTLRVAREDALQAGDGVALFARVGEDGASFEYEVRQRGNGAVLLTHRAKLGLAHR